MRKPTGNTEEIERAATTGQEQVAAAIIFLPPHNVSGRLMMTISRAIISEMQRSNIRVRDENASGLWLPNFVLLLFEVPDRRAALAVLKERIPHYATGLVELAYWCQAEGYWRTVGEGTLPFDRFLSKEIVEASKALLSDEIAALEATKSALARGGGEEIRPAGGGKS